MHGPILLPQQPRPPSGLFARLHRKLAVFLEELNHLRESVRLLREHPEYRGVLSDKAILEEMERRNVVIFPFERKHLATSSYDVTLGENYYKEQDPRIARRVFNPFDRLEVDRIWGKPERAQLITEALPDPEDRKGLPLDSRVILLGPGETILGHTEEFIGGKNIITTMMKARSSFGRNFIEICKCAGWGDVGYINRWTMEITNNSRFYTIPLLVGKRLAQIVFFYTGATLGKDYTQAERTKYHTEPDLERTIEKWRPESMLPRLDKDLQKP